MFFFSILQRKIVFEIPDLKYPTVFFGAQYSNKSEHTKNSFFVVANVLYFTQNINKCVSYIIIPAAEYYFLQLRQFCSYWWLNIQNEINKSNEKSCFVKKIVKKYKHGCLFMSCGLMNDWRFFVPIWRSIFNHKNSK